MKSKKEKVKKTKEEIKSLIIGIIGLLVILGLAILIVYAIIRLLSHAGTLIADLIQKISMLDTVLIVALISGLLTVTGLIVNSLIKLKEYKDKERSESREKMREPYSKFVDLLFNILMSTKDGKKFDEKEVAKKANEFNKDVILYGSNKVIKKWNVYRTNCVNLTPLSPKENLIKLEAVLYAIRKDLGLKKRFMKKGDILSLFINDINTMK